VKIVVFFLVELSSAGFLAVKFARIDVFSCFIMFKVSQKLVHVIIMTPATDVVVYMCVPMCAKSFDMCVDYLQLFARCVLRYVF